jgi:hypothetical protein
MTIYKTLEEALKASQEEMEQAAEMTLQNAGDFARKAAVETNLFHVGNNFNQQTKFQSINRYNGFVRTDLDYAQYLEFGNNEKGAYIYPVNGKAFHFIIGGKDIFCKKARTHGPLPYMSDAGDKLEENIENIFTINLNKAIK